MKKLLFILLTLSTLSNACEDIKPDMIVIERSPIKIKLTAPEGFHFNKDAPTTVMSGGDWLDLQKSEHEIIAWARSPLTQDCPIKYSVILCDDDHTQCIPVKQEFQCKQRRRRHHASRG